MSEAREPGSSMSDTRVKNVVRNSNQSEMEVLFEDLYPEIEETKTNEPKQLLESSARCETTAASNATAEQRANDPEHPSECYRRCVTTEVVSYVSEEPRTNKSEQLEEQLADSEIELHDDLVKRGCGGCVRKVVRQRVDRPERIETSVTTLDGQWEICTVAWPNGMLRYLKRGPASTSTQDPNQPLTFLETVELNLLAKQLETEPGTIPYRARDKALSWCCYVNRWLSQHRLERPSLYESLDQFWEAFMYMIIVVFSIVPVFIRLSRS